MKPLEAFTDFSSVALPPRENDLSRRYLNLLLRWVPVAMRYFNDWPGRPGCGHFFGGVLWYGQDTAFTIAPLALAASSPEFDPHVAGISADELRRVALKGLRYLCFTHDTGPADCVRPEQGWSKTYLAGTKWGERGAGFFKESQCGRTIACLTLTAALIRDLLTDEEREMLANIAADFMRRFENLPPRSGVFYDTQTEENAWTALGMTACCVLLSRHPRLPQWRDHAKLWMFRTATTPEDIPPMVPCLNEGQTLAELCGKTITTLPDGTAENHGFVHPSYMASGIGISGDISNLLKLFGQSIPPHVSWRRGESYRLLKRWCDRTGLPLPVQGMDWPYFNHSVISHVHAHANLYLNDPDAPLLEQWILETMERTSAAHDGRLVPEEQAVHSRGPQDPALMRERFAAWLGNACLAHRLMGAGPTPGAPDEFENRMRGVRVYPHGGFLFHRHARGMTSLAWRNRTMVLPVTSEGLRLIGPAHGSVLATVRVRGHGEHTRHIALKIHESHDRVAALLIQDFAEGAVRRQVFFASLPTGQALTFERITALKDITVESVEQGYLCIINDGYFGDFPDRRGRRRLFWHAGDRTFEGYVAPSPDSNTHLPLPGAAWVNVDDKIGVVFRGSGTALYRNLHHYDICRAVHDDLVLNLHDQPRHFKTGETVAELHALWCPEQTHHATAAQDFTILDTPSSVCAVEIESFLCAANFGPDPVELPRKILCQAGHPLRTSGGVSLVPEADLHAGLQLDSMAPVIIELAR